MVLVRLQNPTLKGDKLLILIENPPSPAYLARLHTTFPDLTVAVQAGPRPFALGDPNLPEDIWDGVTIVTTGNILPDPPQAPGMRLVQLMSAGANGVFQKPLFKETDIPFCTANGVHGPQISEWVISTYLAFNHRLPQYLKQQQEARWSKIQEPIQDAVGKTVGILGYGSIGRQVARVAVAMGMAVHAYTLHAKDTPDSRVDDAYAPPGLGDPAGELPRKWFSGGSTEELHTFLASGLDLLVVALPLTDKTRGLIGKAELDVLGRRVFVSNIARGKIVDTQALMDALEGGVIRGAALDVTDPEPLPDGHKLWATKNLIVTPHVSWMSTAYDDRVLEILFANLKRLGRGEKLMNQVSRRDGY